MKQIIRSLAACLALTFGGVGVTEAAPQAVLPAPTSAGNPGGSSGQVQYNSSGVFAGAAGAQISGSGYSLYLPGNGSLGTIVNAGTGILGVGACQPHSGIGICSQLGTGGSPINLTSDEVFSLNATATVAPTSTTTAAAAPFGIVSNVTWQGSLNNGSNGIPTGTQSECFAGGSASFGTCIGTESAVVDIGSGTLQNAMAEYAHIDNQSTGGIVNGDAVRASCNSSGSGLITNCKALHAGSGSGTNVYGLYIDDQTSGTTSNFAIWTNAGKVQFGGPLIETSTATLPTMLGLTTLGNNTADAGLTIQMNSGQSANPFQVKNTGGSIVFSVSNTGSLTFSNDLGFGGNTAIFGASQSIRIGDPYIDTKASSCHRWTGTTHAYDAIDTMVCRNAVGVVEIDGSTTGGTGTLLASKVQATHTTTVSGLATCNAGARGSWDIVTDATTPTYNGALTGGGAVVVPVWCNGSAWTSH